MAVLTEHRYRLNPSEKVFPSTTSYETIRYDGWTRLKYCRCINLQTNVSLKRLDWSVFAKLRLITHLIRASVCVWVVCKFSIVSYYCVARVLNLFKDGTLYCNIIKFVFKTSRGSRSYYYRSGLFKLRWLGGRNQKKIIKIIFTL